MAEIYPGQYVVPARSEGGYLPKGPPLPNPNDANVLRFTAIGKDVRNSQVLDNTNTPRFLVRSSGDKHLEMFDAANNLIAQYADGRVTVTYQGSGPIKAKKFVKHGAAGKTGAVFIYDGLEYEIVQELFYAVVRSVHVIERVAIIYNYTGKLAVEMIDNGVGNVGLQQYLVFVAALEESKITRGPSKFGKVIRGVISKKKDF